MAKKTASKKTKKVTVRDLKAKKNVRGGVRFDTQK